MYSIKQILWLVLVLWYQSNSVCSGLTYNLLSESDQDTFIYCVDYMLMTAQFVNCFCCVFVIFTFLFMIHNAPGLSAFFLLLKVVFSIISVEKYVSIVGICGQYWIKDITNNFSLSHCLIFSWQIKYRYSYTKISNQKNDQTLLIQCSQSVM